MDTSSLVNLFSGENLIDFFYKVSLIVFSLLYFIYSIIAKKQTHVMNKTVMFKTYSRISFLSTIQILMGIILILLALFVA